MNVALKHYTTKGGIEGEKKEWKDTDKEEGIERCQGGTEERRVRREGREGD